MASRAVTDVLERCLTELVELKLVGEKLVVEQIAGKAVPDDLVAEITANRDELYEWLDWERSAETLWRAVFSRIAHRGDLVADKRYCELEARADAVHRRHDRRSLVEALRQLEAYADKRDVMP